MDYKEEYQKALERAKKGLPIDEVFPELKESEDERIRKELIEAIEKARVFDIDKEVADRWIAYLERQKDIDCLACDQHLKGYIAGRKVTEEEKQKEQKPTEWSDEDEKMLEHIISDLREFRDCETDEELVSDYEDEITWLKFLRPQPKQEREPMKIKYGGKIYQVHGVRAIPGGVPGYIIEDELGGYVCITNPEEVLDS